MVALVAGRIVACGTPHEIVAAPVLAEVFGVEAQVLVDPQTAAPFCIPRKLSAQGLATTVPGERSCNRRRS
jgi:ABC-type hemin transport system ATPase subunit